MAPAVLLTGVLWLMMLRRMGWLLVLGRLLSDTEQPAGVWLGVNNCCCWTLPADCDVCALAAPLTAPACPLLLALLGPTLLGSASDVVAAVAVETGMK